MKSIEELRGVYEQNLKSRLEDLEIQRKTIVKTGLIHGGITLAVAALGLFMDSPPLAIGALIVGLIVLAIRVYKKMEAYRLTYKGQVVAEVIRLIDDSWSYSSETCIPKADYMRSKIFTHRPDRYNGDDYVKGTIDKTDFEFSELHSEYKTTSTDSKGNTRTEWHTIFKGLFFHADFNKEIKGETFVLPDTAEKLFGKFGQRFQKMSSKGKLIKLENQEFEKEFVVYGSEQIEPRYILTPTIMEAMVNIKKQYKHNMSFSFVGSRVFCAISIQKNMFEPAIFRSGVRFEDVQEIHSYFEVIRILIQELNLNTRIWTKE